MISSGRGLSRRSIGSSFRSSTGKVPASPRLLLSGDGGPGGGPALVATNAAPHSRHRIVLPRRAGSIRDTSSHLGHWMPTGVLLIGYAVVGFGQVNRAKR